MRILSRILKTPLEKPRINVIKLIDELRGNLAFQGRIYWCVASPKMHLLVTREKCGLLDFDLAGSLLCCETEDVILS
ncbi:MAG: hypothetical protein OEZ45_09460 [Candidatus Aminicenantes bacterium]|nr:hypothetical protein [Candidatus Aminicenantes bacterium]